MELKVSIDLFSGRPNPFVILNDVESKSLLKRIRFGRLQKQTEKTVPFPSMLGYRGIVIEQAGKRISESVFRRAQFTPDYAYVDNKIAGSDTLPRLESFIFDRIKTFKDVRGFKPFDVGLKKKVNDFWDKSPRWRDRHLKIYPELLIDFYYKIRFKSCYCAPVADLAAWNTDPYIQSQNNCYNYGSNYRTDTYAQPGYASGSEYNDLSACFVPPGNISARMGATADGLIAVKNNNTCPTVGHLVALVVEPDSDYHWYRKGRNGKWSHKMGGSPATLLDDSGDPISDPRTADRGGYIDFCTFMQVIHGHFKIDGPY